MAIATGVERGGGFRATRTRVAFRGAAFLALAAACLACSGTGGWARPSDAGPEAARGARPSGLDVPYEPTPLAVVREMLKLASVGPGDVVYDLGCGDGRIVVEAAKLGARGVGVDLDPERIVEARANARAAGVADRVQLVEGDLFETDVRPATVVMLYLWPDVNLRLRPRLLAQLRPGSRVVSHSHDMGDWKPTRTVEVGKSRLHLWIVP